MNVWLILCIAAGIGIGCWAKWYMKTKHTTLSDTQIVLNTLGKPIHAKTFSVEDIRNWASQHKEILNSGGKALAAKVSNETFSMMVNKLRSEGYMIDFNSHEYFKCILLEMSDSSGNTRERVLVHYENLTPILEELFERGGGKFTLGG